MNFCPQCGTKFDPDARFCQECGFDKNSVIAKSALKQEHVFVPPVVETSQIPQINPVILPKTSESSGFSAQQNTQSAKSVISLKQRKNKKLWLWIILILCVLGTAIWFGYDKYFSSNKKSSADIASNIIISENSKPVSLMDQELAKQKAKMQNQSTTQKSINDEAIESNEVVENEIISEVILEVGHKEESKNKNPKNPTKFTLQKPTMITRIITDHYNDGMGTPRGGIIKIKDDKNNEIGSYKAFGKTGINGTPSAKWIAEPNIMLEKGTYFISDSDPTTWSKTFLGGTGFIVVEGYEIE